LQPLLLCGDEIIPAWPEKKEEAMAATVLYYVGGDAQIVGSTTPPTGAQLNGPGGVSKITVVIGMLLSDTVATVTHNFGLGASAPTFYDPEIIGPNWINGPVGGGTNVPLVTFSIPNTNTVQFNKLGVAGTDGTFAVILRRPHSTGL
jgi:hypothetical protein